jgi:hypothetical protein
MTFVLVVYSKTPYPNNARGFYTKRGKYQGCSKESTEHVREYKTLYNMNHNKFNSVSITTSHSNSATIFIASAVFANAAFGEGTGPIWMSGLTCGTTQLSLFSCTSTSPIGSVPSECRHADDAAVRCRGLTTGNHLGLYSSMLRPVHVCTCVIIIDSIYGHSGAHASNTESTEGN